MGKQQLVPVILCGGSGSRLWPLSREAYPKQFLKLTGANSMLQETLLRLQGLPDDTARLLDAILVTNKEHRFLVAGQLQELQAQAGPKAQILLESQGRNTAPALTLAALLAHAGGAADPVLLAMPADHVIANRSAFHAAVEQAVPIAAQGGLVTFGIVPEGPETGYGYIQSGQPHEIGGLQVNAFVEKPDAATARRYVQEGGYYWNSGLFVVKASVWLKAMAIYRPDILAACEKAMQSVVQDLDFVRPDGAAFRASPSDSIDYAVMEHLPRDTRHGIPACVVPLDAGWSDLGAWDSLWQVLPHDENGNAASGTVLLEECRDTLLFSHNRLIAGVGLDNILVVETPDAVLVAHKDRAQSVKQIVAALKKNGLTLADSHRKVHRPWGWYDSIDHGERFQVKRIVVNPGASLSLQMHHHRAEHWIVVKGTAQVTNGDKVTLLTENQSTYIPLGTVHRLANPGKVPLEIVEVQSGSYLGEDDIVRFEDTYGRTDDGRQSQER